MVPAKVGPKILKLQSSWRRSTILAVSLPPSSYGLLRCTAVLIHPWPGPYAPLEGSALSSPSRSTGHTHTLPALPHTATCTCTLSTPIPCAARPHTQAPRRRRPLSAATVGSLGAVLVLSALDPTAWDVGPAPYRSGCAGLQSPACVRPYPKPLCDIPSGCGFFTWPWTRHPFLPSRAASGRCFLSAAAAGASAGVVSALAVPSGWCAGAVLVAAGAVCALAVPSTPLPPSSSASTAREDPPVTDFVAARAPTREPRNPSVLKRIEAGRLRIMPRDLKSGTRSWLTHATRPSHFVTREATSK